MAHREWTAARATALEQGGATLKRYSDNREFKTMKSDSTSRSDQPASPPTRRPLQRSQQTAPASGIHSYAVPAPTRSAIHITAIALLLLIAPACRTTKPIPRSERTGELSVVPGINDKLKQGDVDKWVDRFEGESREIYTERERIAETVGIKPGMVVADIGAGTGFLSVIFARKTGPTGRVYAVDIVPEFLERIDARAADEGLNNIKTVLCTDDSVELPPAAIDRAFICDTYHHFEYPNSTMATVADAVKPGGELIVVDFIRIPGESNEWVLNHVRAGQEVFINEIEAAGFELLDDGLGDGLLKKNYILRFRRTGG